MPVNVPPPTPQNPWVSLIDNARTPEFNKTLNSWGNVQFLGNGKSAGGYNALGEITTNGGMLWLHGLYGYCGFRWFSDGSLHRYVIQSDGKLKEYRVETVQGNIIYTSSDPFSGSTAGDLFMRQARTKKPFHVTDKSTLALLGWNNWQTLNVTWFYDDTGGVSFGVLPDGSRVVYPLNLTPDGPVPVSGTHYYAGQPVPKYDYEYNGNALPQAPFGKNYGSPAGDTAVPIWTSSDYFTNVVITDEMIKSLPASKLAYLFYTLLQTKITDGCPDYIPTKDISNGFLWGGDAYVNEMDIRLRIYNLRPDMHFIVNEKGEKVIGLVDPLKIPIYNGLRCKESLFATIGLSVAIGLVTMGAGAILPILGTIADLAQFGASVSDLFAAREGMQKMLDFQSQVKTGVAGLLLQTSPTNPTPPPPPAPPAPVRSPVPTVGVVAAGPAPAAGSHPDGPVPATASHNSLAFWVMAILFLL